MVSSEFTSYLIGKVMGDGHLEKTLGSCFFICSDEFSLLNLKEKIILEFNILPKRTHLIHKRSEKGESLALRINCVPFCKYLFSKGAPKGNKVEQPLVIPNWIKENKIYCKAFLQGILEDELTKIKIEKYCHCVNIQLKLSKLKSLLKEHYYFMNSIKSLIESYNIECGEIRYQDTIDPLKGQYYFRIQRNKENIIRFQNNIGFLYNQEKSKSLEDCCNIMKLNNLKRYSNKSEKFSVFSAKLS